MTTTVYEGDYATITGDNSPGIVFLRELMTNLDSQKPKETNLRDVFDESAKLYANGVALSLSDLERGFAMRSQMMAAFHHVLVKAWDIDNGDDTRTIIWESISYSQFPGMSSANAIQVSELATTQVKKDSSSKTGFLVTEMKSYLDPSPVKEYIASLNK